MSRFRSFHLPDATPQPTPGAFPALPAPPGAWYGSEPEPSEPTVPLSHYLWILRRHRWKILSFMGVCIACTLIVSLRVTPIYESTATIDIDRRMPSGILGQEATQAPNMDADQFLATQVKLIQTDSVLRHVVKKYNLKVRNWEPGAAVPSSRAQDARMTLPKLKVTRPANTYLLLISYRSPDPQLAADVANGIARSYIEHTYNIRYQSSVGLSSFMEKQLEELRAKMERSSAALAQFEKELNVINPEEKTSILSARLLQLNTEYTNTQAERMKKEAAYGSIQAGSLEAAQVSSQGEVVRKLVEKLDDADEKFAQARTHFGPNHPEYRRAQALVAQLQQNLAQTRQSIRQRVEIEYREALKREAMLKQAVAENKAEFDRLNARSFEYQALKREAEADKKLYEELTTKIKEAGINAGFQNSAIRLADPARIELDPVFPKLKLNLLLAFLFSGMLAVGAAVLSDVLDNAVRDPEQVARTLGAEVVGSLPLVKDWRRRSLNATPTLALAGPQSSAGGNGKSGESLHRSVTTFQEAVRTLRNSILLGQMDRRLKSLLVTSAGPGEGKTTTAVHLAIAHAQQQHKTLLIDGDLRRPGVSRTLNLNGNQGLSTVLSDGLGWREKLVKLEHVPELDILTAGLVSRRSVDLLGPQLPRLLEEAENEYDLVVLDAPPLLGFPEPLQMAAAVDAVVVVSLAGETNRKAVGAVLTTLQRVRANVVGLVLNEVSRDLGDGYHYYGYYGKYYSTYYKQTKT